MSVTVLEALTKLTKVVNDCDHVLAMFAKTPAAIPAEEVTRVRQLKAEAEAERDFIEAALQKRATEAKSVVRHRPDLIFKAIGAINRI